MKNSKLSPEKPPIQNIERIALWLKTIKNPSFPKLFNSSIHLNKDNQLLLLTRNSANPSKLSVLFINLNTFAVEDKFSFTNEDVNDQNLDTFMFHYQSLLIYEKIYFLKNCPTKDDETVFIGDLKSKKMFAVKNDFTRPLCFRVNYSINYYLLKIIIFGGIKVDTMEPLNILDSFDITTYKWETIKTKGKSPDPRHSHNSFIINDILYILGGTNSPDLFQNSGIMDDLFLLDLKTFCWTPIKTFGSIPKYLGYNYLITLNEKKIMVLWSERGFNQSSFEMQISYLDLVNYEWENSILSLKQPEYRYNAGMCYDQTNKIVYFYGGFYFNKPENLSLGNELDRLKIFEDKNIENMEKIELYGGEKFNIDKINLNMEGKIGESIENSNFYKNDELNIDDEEISFEELLEREKKLQEEEKNRNENKKEKGKKKKTKKNKTKK